MRIYKTRYDFENLDQSEIFPGTICTITDEVDNPTYIYQNSIWNAFVTVPQSEEANPTTFNTNSTQRTFPYILAQSGVPVGIAPNGTIATNGAVTLGTALPTTYSGGIWLRFPANAVVGDSTGGIYWCVMSSTTVGTVYAGKIDTASEFVPYIGSTAGGAVTGSNSAYTQDTSEITLVNVTVPANTLGAYGSLLWQANYLFTNSANNKTMQQRLDGTSISIVTRTTTANQSLCRRTQNCGLTNRQTTTLGEEVNGTASSPSITTKDTTTSLGLTFSAQLATATEFIIFYSLTIEVLPS